MPQTKVSTSGLSIEHDFFGDPKHEAILLVMGLNSQMIAWTESLCKSLAAEGFFVIRFDNRDCGLSEKLEHLGPASPIKLLARKTFGMEVTPAYTLEDMTLDAIELLDNLNIEKAHFVGASMGGMIAQLATINHPDRVLSLTSIMSTSGNPKMPMAKFRIYPAFMKRRPEEKDLVALHVLNIFEKLNHPSTFNREETYNYIKIGVERSCFNDGGRQLSACLAAPDRSEDLKKIKIRTLVIHGREDPLFPLGHAEDLHQIIPKSELVIIDGMGHSFPRQCESTIVEAILKHVKFPSAPGIDQEVARPPVADNLEPKVV